MKPEDGYITYIVNPKSGAQCGKRLSGRFQEYLQLHGFDVHVKETKSLEHTCEVANEAAVDHDCALVVAAGGDGTIRETAHGLEGSERKMMIVPAGTENLLANELGYDEKIETVIRAFDGKCVKPLDLGQINGKCFTSVAGFGFDGDIIEKVAAHRHGHIDYFDYFWPIWRTYWSHKFPVMRVEVDGEEVFEGKGLVFVGNISRYALSLHILKNADVSDGLLDVCIFKCAGKLRLVKHSVKTILKTHLNGKDVVYKQGKNVRVTSVQGDVKTEIDGDPGPPLPAEISILPKAVMCLVPENAKPAGIRARLMRVLK